MPSAEQALERYAFIAPSSHRVGYAKRGDWHAETRLSEGSNEAKVVTVKTIVDKLNLIVKKVMGFKRWDKRRRKPRR
jgi:hypothetical protein